MRSSRSIMNRVRSITPVLAFVLAQACSSETTPQGPAPSGSLELTVAGHNAVILRGYRVLIQVSGEIEPRVRPTRGITTTIWALPPGTHSVRVEALVGNCVVGDTQSHPFTIVAGETSTIELAASCSPIYGAHAGSYEREVPIGTTPAFLSERYLLLADGSIRLRYEASATNSFEYPGAFFEEPDSTGTVLKFLFTGSSMWSATATLVEGCIEVEYNENMWLNDFSNGRYCTL